MYKTRMATEDILVYVFSLPSLLVMKKPTQVQNI